ncbi:hypothetical protein DPMN_083617 [Dreissena polymorpha]|uniref:Uncharacterized protein n=1 Tax=Dreissena polymorpha TaxID=45954 RepID=A0A9D3YD83_DREPO|nr:hypothetical protein DPMN_083617 [Dreissena polymorpha]
MGKRKKSGISPPDQVKPQPKQSRQKNMADGGCTADLSGLTQQPQQQQQQQQHTSGQVPQGLAVFQYSPSNPAPPNWQCATPINSQCPPYYNQFWQSPANTPNTHTSSMNLWKFLFRE